MSTEQKMLEMMELVTESSRVLLEKELKIITLDELYRTAKYALDAIADGEGDAQAIARQTIAELVDINEDKQGI